MNFLKTFGHYLLCQHIIEPFRTPRSSWKKKGTRAWCFWLLLVELGAAWCFGYAVYLTIFDVAGALSGSTPGNFSSFGLFSISEHYSIAVKRHIGALVGTVFIPLHRIAYDFGIKWFHGGIVETCEDEWPCEPEGRLELFAAFRRQ